MKTFIKYQLLFVVAIAMTACGGVEETTDETTEEVPTDMSFEVLSEEVTGISFLNTLTERDTFNYINFQYMYNGGGVALGDINNDGLCDIYFTGNQVSDKLYLNQGGMKFKDITKEAIGEELAKEGWHTGVTMADVNNDGYLDIYVSRSGLETFSEDMKRNLLYINNQDNTFSEKGKEYGIAVSRSTNQAAFFDMDNDGDLDLYVMNRPYPDFNCKYTDRSNFPYSDNLFENVDGKYIDISKEAGIQNDTYGLGIAISDINNDGLQDILIANDYVAPDFLYINQGDNTFVNELNLRIGHICNFSMGNDIADFNNDGLVDIMSVDMVSEDHVLSKKTMAGMEPDKFWEAVANGSHYQYMFNTMQLNNGDGTFSEMAQLAGVSKTDWSWAPLFADFDNDGLKDLFISNGYRRDLRDRDYNKYIDEIQYDHTDFEDILSLTTSTKIENYFFKNMGDLKFKKVMTDWSMDVDVNSNGASYADLDNDGDLDMVVNNMEDVSAILENKLKSGNHYLQVKCDRNYDGLKVTVKANGQIFYQELHMTRGFQSSVGKVLHFGLGEVTKIDEVEVIFNDSKVYSQKDVAVDQLLEIKYEMAKMPSGVVKQKPRMFTEEKILNHWHQELVVNDFAFEILLPHKMSQLGPFLSEGDVNGDQLKDFYVSGSRNFSGTLYLQTKDGKFIAKAGPWNKESSREEMGSLMFDADNDGDLDLYVVNGSNEHRYDSPLLQDQLYVNDGKGNFTNETSSRLPLMITSGLRVTAGDYDQDGDQDLFIGGRQIPGFYPFAPRSFLLRNDGGIFVEVTRGSLDLVAPGLITESVFDDFDQDGDLDLICVGEWMPITFFENDQGKFTNVTKKYNLDNSVGWWMSIEVGDFNGDGKNDYLLGNIGENNKFHPSEKHPLEIYVSDFDKTGTYDIVLAHHQKGTCFPVRGRQCTSEQMPFIQSKFPSYDDFATAGIEEIYGKTNLDSALHISATNFSSSVLLSTDSGFVFSRLPSFAQLGPLNSSIIFDMNNDGFLDILSIGNNYLAEVETMRYDGGRGAVLLGDGQGGFSALAPQESGFLVRNDARDIIRLGDLFVISSNLSPLKIFRYKAIRSS
ncbi:VCBS repeat-containing protein [Crocinitomix catalasitica]|nr:VCBS repeat-containing protein [Crocinitomix catalasitica]